MTVKQRITKYLRTRGWTEGEVLAARIYKGHGAHGYGWYVQPFGETAQWFGSNWADIAEGMKDDMPKSRS